MEETDLELLRHFRGGDRAAFTRLVERWDGRVFGLLYRLTGDAEEARDLRQAVFLRVMRAAGQFNGRARFSSYLYRVVLNLCLDRKRALEARGALQEDAERLAARPDAGPSPDRRSEEAEAARLVAAAVQALPPAERAVVVLRHYEGLAFAEIAEVLGEPASTVKSRMARALRRLRRRLERVDI